MFGKGYLSRLEYIYIFLLVLRGVLDPAVLSEIQVNKLDSGSKTRFWWRKDSGSIIRKFRLTN